MANARLAKTMVAELMRVLWGELKERLRETSTGLLGRAGVRRFQGASFFIAAQWLAWTCFSVYSHTGPRPRMAGMITEIPSGLSPDLGRLLVFSSG